MNFDHSLVRFAVSGTLITCYLVSDALARRSGRFRSKLPTPRWVHPLIVASMGGFYALIGPTGGALLGGWGNACGMALAALAVAMRWGRGVRYPDLGSRGLFYVALPLAVGVPWGLAVLSVPACASSLFCCLLAERIAPPTSGPRYRLIAGLW